MTNEQIIKKALHKIDNGERIPSGLPYSPERYLNKLEYYPLIFSHDFAQKFWGTEMRPEMDLHGNMIGSIPMWKIYLSQMVLEKEPLKYIEKFLKINMKKTKMVYLTDYELKKIAKRIKDGEVNGIINQAKENYIIEFSLKVKIITKTINQ